MSTLNVLDNTQLSRLLRDNWDQLGVGAFADELYTILGGGDLSTRSKSSSPPLAPVGASGSVQIQDIGGVRTGPPGSPGAPGPAAAAGQALASDNGAGTVQTPIALQNTDGGASLVLLSIDANGQPADPSLSFNFGGGGTGDIVLGGIGLTVNVDGGTIPIEFPTTQTVPVVNKQIQLQALPQVFIGVVGSGSGKSYQVTIYPDGPDNAGKIVQATVPQLADDEIVPNGTSVVVILAGTDPIRGQRYFFQPPVWL